MDRFWNKVKKTDTCWIWVGYHNEAGYGMINIKNKPYRAHRLAYEMLVGPIPEGLHIDHLCRVRDCVNPAHMEPVTNLENTRRGIGGLMASKRNAAITHCRQGHEFTPENTVMRGSKTRKFRGCRLCVKEWNKKRYL